MEQTGGKVARVSSCRGVAFEANPYKSNIFAIKTPMQDEQQQPDQGWIWLPWTQKSSFKAFPGSNSLRISMGRSSSHFCDLEVDEEDEHNSMYFDCQSGQDLEKNQQHSVCEVNPNKQLPKPAPKKHNDRLSVILLDRLVHGL